MSASSAIGYVSEPSRHVGLRLIPPLETYPRAVGFPQTSAGKPAVVGAFGLGYECFLSEPSAWLLITLTIGLITVERKLRWKPVALGTLMITAVQPGSRYLFLAVIFGLLLFSWARRWPHYGFGKTPVATLLTGFTLLILVSSSIPRNSSWFAPAWISVGVLASYIWFIGYALTFVRH